VCYPCSIELLEMSICPILRARPGHTSHNSRFGVDNEIKCISAQNEGQETMHKVTCGVLLNKTIPPFKGSRLKTSLCKVKKLPTNLK
jgi:hypothetical protein